MDLHTILQNHSPLNNSPSSKEKSTPHKRHPSFAEIPDLFFDEILQKFRLGRNDILLMMFIYRKTWCHPNIFKEYGLSPHFEYPAIAQFLKLNDEEIQQGLRKLVSYELIEIIRPGQFFIRKFFTPEHDNLYGITYSNF